MEYVLYATCAGIFLSIAILLYVVSSLGRLRSIAERQLCLIDALLSDGDCHRGNRSPGGFSIWRYQDHQWLLQQSQCAPGYEPGPAPRMKGTYDGQCVKAACIRIASK